jgi:hypothetical protein
MRASAYAAITAMTLAWLPAIWISFGFALWAFDINRYLCCDTSPPQYLKGRTLSDPAHRHAGGIALALP